MKINALGINPSANCYLVKLKNVTFLVDCAAELSSLLSLIPCGVHPINEQSVSSQDSTSILKDIKSSTGSHLMLESGFPIFLETARIDQIQIDQLDFILITNFYNLHGLPYITENYGFKGKIYATEPTVQLGRQILLEFCRQSKNNPSQSFTSLKSTLTNLKSNSGVLPKDIFDHFDQWRELYSENEILSCFEKIRCCSFDEDIKVFDGLEIVPHSSGYCLGSCNWIVKTEYEKIAIVAQSCVSSPGGIKNHSQPLRNDVLSNSDCMILSQLVASNNAYSLEAQYADLCNQVGLTLQQGGSVILPIHSSGIILDLFSILDTYMSNFGSSFVGSPGQSSTNVVPMYFFSHISESVLAYANISAEWLEKQKQERVYAPNNPFNHTDLIDDHKLFCFNSINDFNFASLNQQVDSAKKIDAKITNNSNYVINSFVKGRSIIFVGHPSLRLGDVVPIIEMFKNNPRNTIIFTDLSFDPTKAMAPFEPCAMRLHICPLESRLNISDAADLIKNVWKPKRLIVPQPLQHGLQKYGIGSSDTLDVDYSTELIGIRHLDEIKVNLKRQFERGFLSVQLASQIQPKTVGGISLTGISATIHNKDGEYVLKVRESTDSSIRLKPHQNQSSEISTHQDELVKNKSLKNDAMETDASKNESVQNDSMQIDVQSNNDRNTPFSSTRSRLWGKPMPQKIIADLEELMIDQVELEEPDSSTLLVKLPQLKAQIEFKSTKTNIITNVEESRKLLKDLILRYLYK